MCVALSRACMLSVSAYCAGSLACAQRRPPSLGIEAALECGQGRATGCHTVPQAREFRDVEGRGRRGNGEQRGNGAADAHVNDRALDQCLPKVSACTRTPFLAVGRSWCSLESDT